MGRTGHLPAPGTFPVPCANSNSMTCRRGWGVSCCREAHRGGQAIFVQAHYINQHQFPNSIKLIQRGSLNVREWSDILARAPVRSESGSLQSVHTQTWFAWFSTILQEEKKKSQYRACKSALCAELGGWLWRSFINPRKRHVGRNADKSIAAVALPATATVLCAPGNFATTLLFLWSKHRDFKVKFF